MANLGNIFDFMNDPDKDKYDGSKNNNGIKPPKKPMIVYYLIVLGIMISAVAAMVGYCIHMEKKYPELREKYRSEMKR